MSQTLKFLHDNDEIKRSNCPSAVNEQDQKYIITFKGESDLEPDYGLAETILSHLKIFRDPKRMITGTMPSSRDHKKMTIDGIRLKKFIHSSSTISQTNHVTGDITLKGITNNDEI